MTGQTTWNKATTGAGTDPWQLVADMKKALETAGLVFSVANLTEQNGLAALAPGGVLPVPTLVFRTDLGAYMSWNGTVWKVLGTYTNVPGVAGAPIIQAAEVMTTIGGSSVGVINFPQAFPGGLRVCTITDSSAASNGIVVKYRADLSSTTQAKFTAFDAVTGSGIASGVGMYVNYIAIGY